MKNIICFYLVISCFIGDQLNAQAWELKKDKDGIRVWTAEMEGSKIKQFKAEMIIDAQLENVLAVLLDVENMHTWYDRIDFAEEIRRESPFRAVYLMRFGLPWPVKDRYAVVKSTITYDKERQMATIISENDKSQLSEYRGLVRATMINSEWKIQLLEDGQLHVYHYGHMDPSGSVPAWLANNSLENGPIKTLTRLIRKLPAYQSVKVPILE